MKYLSDYKEPKLKTIFKMYGCFFAFSNKQFDEQSKPLVDYVRLPIGLICPRYHANSVVIAIGRTVVKSIMEDVLDNGIHAIVRRELSNHEANYTMSIEDTVDCLAEYRIHGIDREMVDNIFRGRRVV